MSRNNWIKCSDEQPEDGVIVVVFTDKNLDGVTPDGGFFLASRYSDGRWEVDTLNNTVWINDDDVTHWLPLRTPED